MDEKLSKALDFSNYMVTLNNQKRLLEEKYQQDLLHFYNGCQFSVTKETVSFVKLLLENEQTENVVLIDDNNIPTIIEDIESFYNDILQVYFSASNSYHTEYIKLKKQRTVEKLVDYEQS
tara:strand:+ start:174 stop:533 length:360 start_codon:yes stop_codon:yes gene_type:complete